MDAKQSKKNPPTALKKAVKNINNLIRVGDISVATPKAEPVTKSKVSKPNVDGRKKPRVFMDRGVVYLGHIPHGFYEDEMKGFFGQFGHVTRLRLVRSNKTGNSRGFAFIEFRFKEVAQVVAETMNNYLMQNRLLKAVYIPPEKQNPKMFSNCRNYGPETCIGVRNRRAAVQQQNKRLTLDQKNARTTSLKQHLIGLQERLKAQGVDCLFQIDDGSSKRLFEETDTSLPPSKRTRTASPAPKAKSSKSTVSLEESSVAPALKKKSNVIKGQISQKNGKSIKSAKSTDKSSKKTIAVSNKKGIEKKPVEKKSAVKKTVVKKIVKKVEKKKNVAKVASSKKDGLKKSAIKKQIVKKK